MGKAKQVIMSDTKIILTVILATVVTCLLFGQVVVEEPYSEVSLEWDASVDHEWIDRYVVHYGTEPGVYTYTFDAGKLTEATVPIHFPSYWYFAVTAIGTNQLESDFSNEAMWLQNIRPPQLQGDTYVKLTPIAEVSADLTGPTEEVALEPTFIPADLAQAFFKALRIDKITVAGEEQ